MASILKIGTRWRVQIRRAELNACRSFKSETAARQWAAEMEEIADLKKAETDPLLMNHQSWTRLFAHTPSINGLPAEIAALPRMDPGNCVGVYFLFHGQQCVYVGQSANVFSRIQQHHPSKLFDSFSWMKVDLADLLKVEAHYIQLLKPSLNRALKKY